MLVIIDNLDVFVNAVKFIISSVCLWNLATRMIIIDTSATEPS